VAQIWIISDGKRGHLNQSRGLADALLRLRPEWDVEEMPARSVCSALAAGVGRIASDINPPHLILAAGHRTHLTALALSRQTGAKSIVLMKPSLPPSWFDLCLIPEHDRPPAHAHVITTFGVLNRMQPARKKPKSGIILIGGPSKHYGWNSPQVLQQVRQRVRDSDRQWLITNSRRTPADMLPELQALSSGQVEFVPVEQTGENWLAERLPVAEVCWVTPDSVSMVYEALTAGCRVGILELPDPSDSRVVRGLQRLLDDGWLLRGGESTGIRPLNEASRCAEEIVARFSL